jgi:hypothetical protein
MKKGIAIAVVFGLAAAGALGVASGSLFEVTTWRRQASPGTLSEAHAFLADDCTACHTPVRGVEAANCVVCHANSAALLARQPTAFHASVTNCSRCHLEHQLGGRSPTSMDHEALAKIGLEGLAEAGPDTEQRQTRARLLGWVRQQGRAELAPSGYSNVTAEEAILDCAGCHDTKDRHAGLFGKDCAECHATAQWTIAEFRHPSPRSTDCAECHQAPPSHYMEHFAMVSAKVASQPDARVDQCYVCHQTTVWNDIKGVGWYKHH